MRDAHPLTTGQIESTLAWVDRLCAEQDLPDTTPEREAQINEEINEAYERLHGDIPERARRLLYVRNAALADAERLKGASDDILKAMKRKKRIAESISENGGPLARVLEAYREYMNDPKARLVTDAGGINTGPTPERLEGPDDIGLWPPMWRTPQPATPNKAGAKSYYKTHRDELPDGFAFKRDVKVKVTKP